ncbi:MAG: FecR family protein [Mangrovibacterium sp.]
MARKKYTDYSVEELLEDADFVSAVKQMKTDDEWDQFLQYHDGPKGNMHQARKFIRLMQTNEEKLTEEKKEKLWRTISKLDREYRHTWKDRKIKMFISMAASIIIIFTLGSLLFSKLDLHKNQYRFSESQRKENSVLILPGGEKVDLMKTESEVAVLKEQGAIQIDQDSIIKAKPVDKKEAINEIIIPFGKKSKLTLADGTTVWINAGSRFAFPQKFEGNKREVYLDGEAYFEVAKNKKQPFIVHSNDFQVEVLGTKFNVCGYSSDNYSETVLLEGSINISVKGRLFNEKLLMEPHQKAVWCKDRKAISLTNEPVPELYIAWVEGWYQFSDENLEEVLRKVERYYNVTFQYDQALISKALPVSGKLDLKESIDEVMTVISRVTKIDYQISGDSLIMIK